MCMMEIFQFNFFKKSCATVTCVKRSYSSIGDSKKNFLSLLSKSPNNKSVSRQVMLNQDPAFTEYLKY
jgi:hypothetical protein